MNISNIRRKESTSGLITSAGTISTYLKAQAQPSAQSTNRDSPSQFLVSQP